MRNQLTADTAAAIQVLAREILNEINQPIPVDLPARVTAHLEEAVDELLYRERERCVEICKRRAALWSNTSMSASPIGREESRARTNEAIYIADAIRALSG
jgi:hypothetical protein